jgi:hypothetical protein
MPEQVLTNSVTSANPGDALDALKALNAQLNALRIKAAVAGRNKERAVEEARVATAAVVATFGRGKTWDAVDPRNPDVVLAKVNVSKETYEAKFVDRAAAESWVEEKYPEKVEKHLRVRPGNEAAALDALKQYAGFLLEEVQRVPEHEMTRLLINSQQAHEPMGLGNEIGDDAPPGIKVDPRTPRVTFPYLAPDLIDELIEQGVIDHEGNVLRGGA